MESHPLNLAHQQHRRAEAHLMNNRYDEAMQCHHNAAELLLDAMKSTTSTVALESITLQHSYHLKQKDLIKTKKEQYARVKKAMDNIKWLGKDPFLNVQGNEYSKLQVAIYRAINETDSLLHILSNKQHTPETAPKEKIDVTDGRKVEKPQHTVVEELQILSQNLHGLVEQLVLQVEVLKDENTTLKEKVNYLEKERAKYLNLPPSNNEFLWKNNFNLLGMTSEGYPNDSSSFALNQPDSRPSDQTELDQSTQPPNFDLSALKNDRDAF